MNIRLKKNIDLKKTILGKIKKAVAAADIPETASIGLWYDPDQITLGPLYLCCLTKTRKKESMDKDSDTEYYLSSPWEWNNDLLYSISDKLRLELDFQCDLMVENITQVEEAYLEITRDLYKFIKNKYKNSVDISILISDAYEERKEYFKSRLNQIF